MRAPPHTHPAPEAAPPGAGAASAADTPPGLGSACWHWIARHVGGLAVIPVILVTAVVHGVNLFQFPYYHTDEGTYVAQAWAILRRGELAHYTYWYDHAPLGWIQVAAWTVLTQGFYTFGTPIDSGRVFMLLLQCCSTFLVFWIARTISRSVLTATLASLLFGLSAYGIYYHRRILLDNITTAWMLLSIAAIIRSPLALSRVWVSAVALGFSVLSKELTIFLAPVLGVIIWMRANRSQRLFATLTWVFLVGAIVSIYPLMALLKSELFPSGSLLGGTAEHVSLIESLQTQAARGRDDGLLSLSSSFWRETAGWAQIEPLIAIGGSLGAIVGAILVRRFPRYGAISLSALALYAFLARGGIILGFYYVPLLPLLALTVALPTGWLVQAGPALLARHVRLTRWPRLVPATTRAISWALAGLCLVPLAHGYQSGALGLERDPAGLWTISQAAGQREAIGWIRRYAHPESAILVDDEVWVALHEQQRGQPVFNNAHWYFKLDGDPEIRFGVFKNEPRNVDYVLTTQDVYDRSREPDMPLARAAIDASAPIATFDTGRYPIEVRRVFKLSQWRAAQDPMLAKSWAAFKAAYIQRGQVVNPEDGSTTAEAQANAMLRSVYMDDRATFDDLWAWTRARLQARGDGLLASRYGADPTGAETVLIRATTAAADQEAALALLFAARQWRQLQHQQYALEILDGIWRHETVVVGGSRIVVGSDIARNTNGRALVTPSALMPYAYRIFATADTRHPWGSLVDSSYRLLGQIQTNPDLGARAGAIPGVVALDLRTGALIAASHGGPEADMLSAHGAQVAARHAVDLIWNGEARAHDVLERLSLPRQEIVKHGRLATMYNLDGQRATNQESMAMYAWSLPSLLFQGNDDLAHLILADKILRPAYDAADARPHVSSLADESAAWFATALMHGGLANLWAGETTVDWQATLARIDTQPSTGQPGLLPGALNAALAAGSGRSAIARTAAGRSGPDAAATPAADTSAVPWADAPAVVNTRSTPAAAAHSTTSAQTGATAAAPRTATPSTMTAQQPAGPAVVRRAVQTVIVPSALGPPAGGASSASRPTAAPPPATRAAVVPAFRPTAPESGYATYVVQTGDSLLDIAERHGTDLASLVAVNALDDPDQIQAGAALSVPVMTAAHDP